MLLLITLTSIVRAVYYAVAYLDVRGRTCQDNSTVRIEVGKVLTEVLENPEDAVGHAEFLGNFYQQVEKFEIAGGTIDCGNEARALAERQAEEVLWAHQISVLGPALARVADIEGYEKVGGRYGISGDVFLEPSGQLVERVQLSNPWQLGMAISVAIGAAATLASPWIAGAAIGLIGPLLTAADRKRSDYLGVAAAAIGILCVIALVLGAARGIWSFGYQGYGLFLGLGLVGLEFDKWAQWINHRAVSFKECRANKSLVAVLKEKFEVAANRIGIEA